MVGPVDLGVAVEACLEQQLLGSARRRNPRAAIESARMEGLRVALLAEPWRTGLEQSGLHRTMRIVAVAAVFADRRVLPQERSAFVGVAGIAGLVDGVLDQQLGPARSMRIVAIRADHLCLHNRMMRGHVRLGSLLLVASEADEGLGGLRAHLIVLGVDIVA